MYWRNAKLSELGAQQLPTPTSRNALLVPIPSMPSPSAETLLSGPLTICSPPHPASVELSALEGQTPRSVRLTYEPDGLLFYVAAGVVESGLSCLAGWVPVGDACERLAELCGSVDREPDATTMEL